jgi:thiamine pyrophosphate-dependent acetolactate synthase large subunit-like protein
MNGAQSLVQTLINCGVDTCFANPGTPAPPKCIWLQLSTP